MKSKVSFSKCQALNPSLVCSQAKPQSVISHRATKIIYTEILYHTQSETATQTHTECQGLTRANKTCYNTRRAKSDSNEQTKYNTPSNTSVCQLKQKHSLTNACHTDSEGRIRTGLFVLKRACVFKNHMGHTMKKVMVLPPCIVPY